MSRRTVLGRLAAGVAALAITVAGLAAVAPSRSEAAGLLAGFDPADIISDGVMFNGATMSASAIQAFLEKQQPTCASGATCLKAQRSDIQAMAANPMCRALAGARDQTVAQIIQKVAVACSVNPQVMLVMLQKEQTLVTGRRPYSGETVQLIYRKATGLGCPDTAPCDPAKYGLFNQLYGVAYWLVRYTMPPGTGPGTAYSSVYNWFPVGRANGVLYNPNAACGAGTITIRNKATASLYYYTPYQPNAAALAAGWGTGNSCSAYGNRNFYLYFTTWFGSTTYAVTGAFASVWKANKSALGEAVSNASGVAGGSRQRFAHGTIYSSGAGTWALTGAIDTKFSQAGGPDGVLGWPRMAPVKRKANGGGTVEGFQHGTVFSSSAGTFLVTGAIHTRYAKAKAEAGSLGYPTGDPATAGGGTQQAFRGGRIVSTGSGTVVLSGAVLSKWLSRGAQGSTLGWPVKEATTVSAHGIKATVQTFATGQVLVPKGTVYTVTGDMYRNYAFHGGPAGSLGWPRAVNAKSTANGGGWTQRFTGGTIYYSAKTGAHPMAGAELKLYNHRGGTKGTLGWPGARVTDRAGICGHVTPFTNGRIYSSKAGTVAVLGAILERYLAKKGPSGVLGWPTGAATTSKGVTTQRFQHGRITWSASAGAKTYRS